MKLERWIIAAAALAAALGTARLGWWQLDRASQKLALQRALESQRALPPLPQPQWPHKPEQVAQHEHRLVQLRGRWLPEHTVYLENRPMAGRVGFIVLTPLALSVDERGQADAHRSNGATVLVQRGWWPRHAQDRERIDAPKPPQGEVAVLGRVAQTASRAYELGAAASASGRIRQNVNPADFAKETGLALLPMVVVQEERGASAKPSQAQSLPSASLSPASASNDDGLLRQWPEPALGRDKHLGYAAQWFALSALVLVLYLWFQWIKPRRAKA